MFNFKRNVKMYGRQVFDCIIFALIMALVTFSLTACATNQNCPPKSDTQVISETVSDILVPKIRWGC